MSDDTVELDDFDVICIFNSDSTYLMENETSLEIVGKNDNKIEEDLKKGVKVQDTSTVWSSSETASTEDNIPETSVGEDRDAVGGLQSTTKEQSGPIYGDADVMVLEKGSRAAIDHGATYSVGAGTNAVHCGSSMSDDIELDEFDVIFFPKEIPVAEVDGCRVVDYLDYEPPLTFPDLSSVGGIQVLKIFTNYLSGPLPDSISNLTSLEWLFLSCSTSKQGDGISSLPSNFHRLSRLEILNLCGNQLTAFPTCICDLSNLKKLYLNGCRLSYVPSAISSLQCLEELDLSSNLLISLPAEFFSLPKLQELYLNNCGLKELPPEIGNLKKLSGLRVSNNLLKEFPEQFYELECLAKLKANHNFIKELSQKRELFKSLEILCLMDNNLTELPKEIGHLRNLRYLDVSENNLTSIPEEITELSRKDFGFRVERNFNLHVPPLEVCQCGLESIRGYYESVHADNSGVIHSRRLKTVLLGESGAGKSSLAYALVHGKAPDILPDDRTIGIEFITWKPTPKDPEGLNFQIVDCAGQRRYRLTHPFFLSEDALHMLVVNISKYEPTSGCFKEMVGDWLDLVAARISEPRIMVVPTHIDECTDASGAFDKPQVTARCRNILARIQRWQKESGEELQKELNKRRKLSKKVLGGDENEGDSLEKMSRAKNHPPIISSVLCFEGNTATEAKKPTMKRMSIGMVPISNKEGLLGLHNLKQEITRVAEDKDLFPKVGVTLPEKWVKLEKEISSYRQNLLFPCVTYDQFAQFAGKRCGLMERALLGAIRYWDTIGRLKYYDEIPDLKLSVVLDLKWLAKLMKLLFRHDHENTLQYRTEYFDKFGVDDYGFSNDAAKLKQCAVLSFDLLRCIWMEMQLNCEQFEQMVLLLKHFGLACELPTVTSNLGSPTVTSSPSPLLLVPWFLTQECNQEVRDDWPDIPDESQVEVRLKFVPNYLPSGLFDRLRVRCHCCVDDYVNWHDGMMVFIRDIKILVSVCESKPPSIVITGRNDRGKLNDLWRSILLIVRETEHLLEEWHGINFTRYTICPHCVKSKAKKPWAFLCNWLGACTSHPGDRVERCKATGRPQRVAVDLILPPPDVVKQFEGPSRLLINPVSDEVSDELLSDLSKRLPLAWRRVGIKLGCTQTQMDSIEIDYPRVEDRTMRMFRRWSQDKGSAATRKELVRALLAADCTGEAEFVCNYS